MRHLLILFLVVLSISSCDNTSGIENSLEGDWVYEREVFSSFTTFEDPDVRGLIRLNSDETGTWESDGQLDYELEWDLQAMGSKIAITKTISNFPAGFVSTTIFDLVQNNDDQFTLTFSLKFDVFTDTITAAEQFENIILTRVQ